MSTYRERREARAEKLREWADGREAKSDAAHQASHDATAGIPFGQPILIGHHSEKRHRRAIERAHDAANASLEHSRKADDMRSRAENIEAAAANAIYSDDPDAIERLREKLAGLEGERARWKAYNASCRKAAKAGEAVGDLSLLDDHQRADLLSTARVASYMLGKGGAAPSYQLTNLGGNISRTRERLARLEREATTGPRDRIITARFASTCGDCGAELERGQMIRYNRAAGARCMACEGPAEMAS